MPATPSLDSAAASLALLQDLLLLLPGYLTRGGVGVSSCLLLVDHGLPRTAAHARLGKALVADLAVHHLLVDLPRQPRG